MAERHTGNSPPFIRQIVDLISDKPSAQDLNAAHLIIAKWRTQLIENTIISRDGTAVQSGPFKGMSYANPATEEAEAELLDPTLAPGLLSADFLVECHERLSPGITAEIERRFAPSHSIARIERETSRANLPGWMADWSDLDRALSLWESRGGPTPWLWIARHG